MNSRPIGIFDSGVGGLTVLRRIFELLPQASTVYFGDTARLPYGEKSPQAILHCSLQNALFLSQHDIGLLVIACHTAASHSTQTLRERLNIPVLDVIEAGIDAAVSATRTGKIAVLGTRATIHSGVYPKRIQARLPEAEVISIACPLFVPLVEENFLSHPATSLIVAEYLRQAADCDTVVLGCTHYPHLLPVIRKFLGDQTTIIDSAEACARSVAQQALEASATSLPARHFYVSDDPEKFRRQGERFLGMAIDSVGVFSTEECRI